MKNFIYRGTKTREISFPLGGIGSGCIGLSGNGRLIDWEIYNRPNKGSINGFTHFAIKAETDTEVLDARVLNADLQPSYNGGYNKTHFLNLGFGPNRATLAGMPHFKDVSFKGTYPIAELSFIDDTFPGNVKMTAFNPFIPLNDKDSSIPGAFFEFEIKNILDEEITYTLALSASNPFISGKSKYAYLQSDKIHTMQFSSNKLKEEDINFGDMCIATDASDVSYQEYWYRGDIFEELTVFWKDFIKQGKFKNRTYGVNKNDKALDTGTLAARVSVLPGAIKKVRFLITWNYPTCANYWNLENMNKKTWKNFYSTIYNNSKDSAMYSLKNWDRLFKDTSEFKNAIFSSTLPKEVIDAISANLSTLKSPTCLRLEDGSFYGFEGCFTDSGCCEGSCSHVWNYAYVLPFLFPKLERSMRDLDYRYNQDNNGGMAFRLQLPIASERTDFRPCADGQFGGVVKAYRDWKISGDSKWLKRNWEAIKKSIEFAWSENNPDYWDENKDGVLEGRQHHTLDKELFGPNSWLTGFYLAALKAGAEIAEFFGETEKAKEYFDLFKKGKRWVDENLFNGEYYIQKIDIKDKNLLEKHNNWGGDAISKYWDEEHDEIKYQIKEGCIIDQVVAQWHANLCGLGEIFDNLKVKKSLESIFKYNFKQQMRDYVNPTRAYALNDESGLIICEWPKKIDMPEFPITCHNMIMYGFEYQVASHMIQEGLYDEGIKIVKAIRERFDGEKRNPWNEMECGSNYARSMASYALINSFSGFEFNMVIKMIGFKPVVKVKNCYKTIWSLDSGWGTFEIKEKEVILSVLSGYLNISILKLESVICERIQSIILGEKNVSFHLNKDQIIFAQEQNVSVDNPLILNCSVFT